MKNRISLFICLLVFTGSYGAMVAQTLQDNSPKEKQEKPGTATDEEEDHISSYSAFEAVLQAPDFHFDNDFEFVRHELILTAGITPEATSDDVPGNTFFDKLYSSSILINAP